MTANATLIRLAACLLAGAIAASPAAAHTGHAEGSSLFTGALHPLSGLDHIAAMISVGLWAALAGGRRAWAWPLAFVVAMLGGAMLGLAGFALPAVEPAIAASVIVLGLAVASGLTPPLLPGAALVALFALFHGHAHGTEAPGAGWTGYAAGFALSTALLHVAGIAAGTAMMSFAGRLPVRGFGAVAAVLGLVLLVH